MLSEALSYPRRGDDWLKTLLIGGVLTLFGFLLVPAIPLQGYLVRVLRSAARGEERPPSFDGWGELFVDGLELVAVGIGYLFVPYVVVFAGAILSGGSDGGSTVGGVLTIVGFVLVALAAYVLPVALTNFAFEERLGAAFEFEPIVRGAFTGRYFIAVVLSIVVFGILNVIASLLALLVVGIFLLFYLQVALYYLLGLGCAPALREHRDADPVADRRAESRA